MKLAPFITAIIIIVSAAVINHANDSEVLGVDTASPSPSYTPSVTPTASATPVVVTQAPTATPTASMQPSEVDNGWVYPGASVVSNDPLVLQSADSTDAVTAWYRAKIEADGYNVRNSIKTSSNGLVKNVVQATKNEASVSVEISKSPDSSLASIEVSF
jgi:hypothetical protein